MGRLTDLDEFLDDDDIDFPEDSWDWGYVAGTKAERERIVKDFEAACRCDGRQSEGITCWADWAIKIVNEYWKKEQK